MKEKEAKLDQSALSIIVAICVVLITIVFYLIYKYARGTRRGVLLTGICNAGKTLIYARLTQGEFRNTHTSIIENSATYETKKGSVVDIIDLPGHDSLRANFIDKYKRAVRGLIFVIDSSTIQSEIKQVAEYLYNILTDSEIMSNCNRILIFCNKQDQLTSRGASVVRKLLEEELDIIRETRSHSLRSTSGGSDGSDFLGHEGSNFEFSQLNKTIDFAEGSAMISDDQEDKSDHDLKGLESWLEAVA